MRPLRLLVSLSSCVIAATLLLFLGVRDSSGAAQDGLDPGTGSGARRSGLGAMFSFHGPLFPLSAIISLTEDNSTFFVARPAAFGPLLPTDGLSGRLWTGDGYVSERFGDAVVDSEGELGCGDALGWRERPGDEEYGSLRHKEQDSNRTQGSTSGPAAGRQRHGLVGKIALLSRGGCGFLDKVQWAQNRGSIAVIVGDNTRGGPIITMYARGDTSNVTIPAIFTSRTTAQLLSTLTTSSETVDTSLAQEHLRTLLYDAQPNRLRHPAGLSNDAMQIHKSWLKSLASLIDLADVRQISAILGQRFRHDSGGKSVSKSLKSTHTEDRSSTVSHDGLWITLTPTNMSSNPFLDTLLVLVVSPLVTLTVVYALLLLRARVQRHRLRAPKSIVDRLPVRTYHTLPSSTSQVATPMASSPTTPLLQSFRASDVEGATSSNEANEDDQNVPEPSGARSPGTRHSEHEKDESGLEEWRRKYGGRQKECVVCLEEYEDGVSRVMRLPCGHEFHVTCITPWLTRRRRTCPICKSDVVRSMARNPRRNQSPSSPTASVRQSRGHQGRHSSNRSSISDSFLQLSNEDVQTQAATRRNDSPSAAIPIPVDGTEPLRQLSQEDDLERGLDVASAPEARMQTGGSNVWRRVGSLGLPSFLSGMRSGSPNQREDRRTR